jgi:O-antigen ligase
VKRGPARTIFALKGEVQAATADWSSLPRAFALAGVHLGFFIAICAISYLRLPIGATIGAVILSVVALVSPLSGLALVLIAVLFQYLFWFAPADFCQIAGALSVAYILRTLPASLTEARKFSMLWLLLSLFVVIVLLHLSAAIGLDKNLQAVGFCLLTMTVFLHARKIAGTLDAGVVIASVLLGGFVAAVMSFAYLYVPIPNLFLSHSPLFDLRLGDLRLIGAQDNPNSLARILLPGYIFLMAMLFLRQTPRWVWIALFAIDIILYAATGTKSILLILLPLALIIAILARRRWLLRTSLTAIGSVAAVIAFTALIAPTLKAHAAKVWQEQSEPQLDAAYYVELAKRPALRALLIEFRLATCEEPRLINGREVFVSCPQASGSNEISAVRVRLLEAGYEVIRAHPWWGIGHKRWPAAMKELMNFPFVSPHNGFLETWGTYGVPGAALYLAVMFFSARNYIRIERRSIDLVRLWLNRSVGLYLLAIFIHELVEVSTILAVTPIALWAWAAIGLQDGMAQQLAAGEPGVLVDRLITRIAV